MCLHSLYFAQVHPKLILYSIFNSHALCHVWFIKCSMYHQVMVDIWVSLPLLFSESMCHFLLIWLTLFSNFTSRPLNMSPSVTPEIADILNDCRIWSHSLWRSGIWLLFYISKSKLCMPANKWYICLQCCFLNTGKWKAHLQELALTLEWT